jgi:hypothetical protein
MRRVILTAGAVLIMAAPAFADQVTIEKKTITKDVPESGSTVPTVIVAPNPPPPPRAETPPPPPGPEMVWLSGHWSWTPEARNYVWVEGKYAAPPRPRAAWLPGRWMQRPEGWVWEEGRWD